MLRRPAGRASKPVDEVENGYRRRILHHFYGSTTLPSRTPDAVNASFGPVPVFPWFQYTINSSQLLRIDQIVNTVGGPEALTIHCYHLRNKTATSKLFISHEGHSYYNLPNHSYHLNRLLDIGWDVVCVQMPMKYIGPSPPYPDALSDTERALNHPEWAQAREGSDPGYVRTFLEPVFFTKQHLVSTYGYTTVAMAGISGGGWTTNMAAALDTSIVASWCVSGSLPWDLRNHVSRGDFEQLARAGVSSTFETPTTARPFYSFLPREYYDLYAMGATHGRFTRQVYIESDQSGSFQPDGRHDIIDRYIMEADRRVSGTVAVAYDTSQSVHCISNWTGDLIISDIQALGL